MNLQNFKTLAIQLGIIVAGVLIADMIKMNINRVRVAPPTQSKN
jgi:mannose/fructose/N-acetylgalactosamine-specific phosphotransferase system component IID